MGHLQLGSQHWCRKRYRGRSRCGVSRRQANADGVFGDHLDHVGRAVGEARDGERGRCQRRMNEIFPRCAAVARILHEIVGDRRAAGTGRGGPRHGQLGVAAYGHYGCRLAWHCRSSNRYRIHRWRADTKGVLGDHLDPVGSATGKARYDVRPCSRYWACHTSPRRAAVGGNLYDIVGDMRSACAGRGIPRNCNLPGARNSR